MIEYKNILFCTDFSEDANIAFLHALDLAKRYGARLHILHIPHSSYAYLRHVVDEHVPEDAPGGEAFFDEEIAEKAEKALKSGYEKRLGDFKDYEMIIRCGSPDVEIIRYARKNDIDVIEALKTLGYSNKEAVKALKKVDQTITDIGEKTKAAIKFL